MKQAIVRNPSEFSRSIENAWKEYSKTKGNTASYGQGLDARTLGEKQKHTRSWNKLVQAIKKENLDVTKTVGALATRTAKNPNLSPYAIYIFDDELNKYVFLDSAHGFSSKEVIADIKKEYMINDTYKLKAVKHTATQKRKEFPKYLKNPTQAQVQKCKKVLAENEKDIVPTISHWMDKENGTRNNFPKDNDLLILDFENTKLGLKDLTERRRKEKPTGERLQLFLRNEQAAFDELNRIADELDKRKIKYKYNGMIQTENPSSYGQFSSAVAEEKRKLATIKKQAAKEIRLAKKTNNVIEIKNVEQYWNNRIADQTAYIDSLEQLSGSKKNPKPMIAANPYGVKMESWIDAKLTEFATDLIEFDKIADYKAEKKALLDYAEQIADWANITRKKAVYLLTMRKGVILKERKNPSYGKHSAHYTNTYKKQLLANYKEALKEAEEKGYESSAAEWRKRIKDIDYAVAKYAQSQKANNPQTTAVNPSNDAELYQVTYKPTFNSRNKTALGFVVYNGKRLQYHLINMDKFNDREVKAIHTALKQSITDFSNEDDYNKNKFPYRYNEETGLDVYFRGKAKPVMIKKYLEMANPQTTAVNPKLSKSQAKENYTALILDKQGDITTFLYRDLESAKDFVNKTVASGGFKGMVKQGDKIVYRANVKTKQNALSEYAIYKNPKLNFTKPFVEKLAKDKDYATRVWAQKWLKSTGKAKQQADEVLFSRLASIGGIGFDFYRQYKNPVKNAPSEYAIYENHIDETLNKHSAMFQGEITGKITKVPNAPFMPKQQSRLGKLKSIELANGTTLDFGDALLSMDIRKNLFITGKDSRFSNVKLPKQNGVDSNLIDLGGISEIRYITRKKHIENGALVEYYHKTGEVTGELPHLFVHNPSKQLYIFGGNYDVWTSGIVN